MYVCDAELLLPSRTGNIIVEIAAAFSVDPVPAKLYRYRNTASCSRFESTTVAIRN
jgi:hypothetical protein